MRINRGRFLHRNLETNPGETTRPITARVKVSLFERLQERLQDARVADVFAGTGTMGLEALSRGARSVVFVENDRSAFERLKKNVEQLGVQDETICWRADAARCSYRPNDGEAFLPFDVIFFDPPYATTEHLSSGTLLHRAVRRLARPDISAPSALLVLRCASGTTFEMPPEWEPEQVLTYSSMDVHLFRKPPPAATPEEAPGDPAEQPAPAPVTGDSLERREASAGPDSQGSIR